jgi:hypothetical protein
MVGVYSFVCSRELSLLATDTDGCYKWFESSGVTIHILTDIVVGVLKA